jgi:hypothetical protein
MRGWSSWQLKVHGSKPDLIWPGTAKNPKFAFSTTIFIMLARLVWVVLPQSEMKTVALLSWLRALGIVQGTVNAEAHPING